MPASPEVADTQGAIWSIEILRQYNIEEQCNADRHIRVPAEIKVKLEGIGQHSHPGVHEMSSRGKAAIGKAGQGIRDDHFFAEADAEQQGTLQDIVPVPELAPQSVELRHHLLVVKDRTCNQMGEEGNE